MILVRLLQGDKEGVWVCKHRARELQRKGEVLYVLDMSNNNMGCNAKACQILTRKYHHTVTSESTNMKQYLMTPEDDCE